MAIHHNNEEIALQQQRWQTEVVEPMLARTPERQAEFATLSGLPLPRVHTPLDSHDSAYLEQMNFPGQFPFTRGVHPTMYRGRPGRCGSMLALARRKCRISATNFCSAQGQKGLSVAFDLPTQMGMTRIIRWRPVR